jgi:two-component system nitrate/nitrite response regulator NarL
MAIKVLLADDALMMRQMIRVLLQQHSELELVGEAGNFGQAMRMASDLKPDVVLLDLHMPGGIDAVPADVRSRLEVSGSKVVAISIWNDEDSLALAKEFGAVKLLNKMELGGLLVPTILHVALADAL